MAAMTIAGSLALPGSMWSLPSWLNVEAQTAAVHGEQNAPHCSHTITPDHSLESRSYSSSAISSAITSGGGAGGAGTGGGGMATATGAADGSGGLSRDPIDEPEALTGSGCTGRFLGLGADLLSAGASGKKREVGMALTGTGAMAAESLSAFYSLAADLLQEGTVLQLHHLLAHAAVAVVKLGHNPIHCQDHSLLLLTNTKG